MERKNVRKLICDFLQNRMVYIILIVQILILVYCNLFRISEAVDCDSAKLMGRAMEIWNRKALFLDGWRYQTTAEIDCSAIIASLIYGITGKIFLSFGISNLINLALWLYIIWKLFGNMNISKQYAVVAMSIIIVPYSFGMLDYTNMLFFGGAVLV